MPADTQRLLPAGAGQIVRCWNGGDITTDGPAGRTRQQLAGWVIAECNDLDAAVRLATTIPAAWTSSVEIRPISETPAWLGWLPRRVDRITTSLEHGTLTTSVRLLADERDRQFIASMAGRAVLAFLGAAFGVISVMLIGVHCGPLFRPRAAGTGGTSLFHVFGYVGLFFSLVLILRVIIAITREGI